MRQGRAKEFSAFAWRGEVPDPQADSTFLRSRLDRTLADEAPHRILRAFYRELVALRRLPALREVEKGGVETAAWERESVLAVRQCHGGEEALLMVNFAESQRAVELPIPAREWRKRLDSADLRWSGPGAVAPAAIGPDDRACLTLPATSLALYGASLNP